MLFPHITLLKRISHIINTIRTHLRHYLTILDTFRELFPHITLLKRNKRVINTIRASFNSFRHIERAIYVFNSSISHLEGYFLYNTPRTHLERHLTLA